MTTRAIKRRRLMYPKTKRGDTIDTYHGTKVPDPYRWLEDPDSEETKAWVEEQNRVTDSVLKSCPDIPNIKKRLTELLNYEKFGCPMKRGESYYYFKNNGLQNQAVLYKCDSLKGASTVLLDPNLIEKDGTAALRAHSFSDCGKWYAYGVSKSGSDWQTIYIRDTETCNDLEEQLDWVKFSDISWTSDSKGFFYSRYPKPSVDKDKAGCETEALENHCLYYHKLFTPQGEDILVFSSPENPKWMATGEVTHDGRYLLIDIREGCDRVNRLYYIDLSKDWSNIVKLVDNFEAEHEYICNNHNSFYFKTNKDAPRYKVICMELDRTVRDIIPESKDVLDTVCFVNNRDLLTIYIQDVKNVMLRYTFIGERWDGITLFQTRFKLPCHGTISALSGRWDSSEIFFKFTSFLYPGSIFRFDLMTGEQTVFKEAEVPGFDPEQFEVRQVFYPSNDGTKIPMYCMHRKGLAKDGDNPTYLYGYGGFGISLMPSFSTRIVMFMQNFDGVVGIANLRGGGCYGERFHHAGYRLKKQNVFDDFHSAARFLIKDGYTNPDRIAALGASNGGLLVAACANQCPDLYAAVVPQCGVLDMLRFQHFSIGFHWTSEYLSSDTEEGFNCLIKYSPLHNVPTKVDRPFPAVLVTTADHDDRVVPAHSYKYTAALQHYLGTSPNPLVIRVETKAGHGAGKPLSKMIDETADVFGFISKHIGAIWKN